MTIFSLLIVKKKKISIRTRSNPSMSLQGSRSPFNELDIRAPIREQLANLVVLEYPQIHVFLPSHSYDFDVNKVFNPRHHQPELKESCTIDHPSPKGFSFRGRVNRRMWPFFIFFRF